MRSTPALDDVQASVDDVKIVAEESIVTAGQPDLDAIDSLNQRDEAAFSAFPECRHRNRVMAIQAPPRRRDQNHSASAVSR